MRPHNAYIEALFRDHAGAVLAYALRRTDPATADEVVADVFVVAVRKPQAIPPEPRPWLLGVARRVLANQRRYAARQARLYTRMATERSLESNTDGDGAVLRALASLREGDREILILVGWDGLNSTDGASTLGISETAFRTRLHRARSRFASALNHRDGDAAGADDPSPPIAMARELN